MAAEPTEPRATTEPQPTEDSETGSGTPEDEAPAPEAVPESAPVPLLTLRDGLPEITESEAQLAEVVSRVAAGSGPIALDAERASGYRYSPRAT